MKKGKKCGTPNVNPPPNLLSTTPYYYHYLLVALLAGIVYANTLKADFVYDDRPAILSNDDVLGRSSWLSLVTTNDFWGNPIRLEGSHKSYRPLITASFRLQFGWHGAKSELFHGVNLVLHVVNSMLVLKLARMVKVMEDDLSLFSALLFACHPITSEAVCSIVGRADLLATTWILLTLISHISNGSAVRTIALAVLAVLSKETGIILIPLVVCWDVLFKNPSTKRFRRDITNYIISLLIICYFRLTINNFQSPKFSKNDNPIAHDPNIVTRTLTFLYLPILHLKLMILPKTLSFDWSMDAIPKVESMLDSRFILASIFYAVLLKVVGNLVMDLKKPEAEENVKNLKKSTLFLLALLTLPHILSSNLLTYVGFVAAERILYLNTVAYCILVGAGVEMVRKRFPTISSTIHIYPFLILLLSISTYRTLQRVQDWKSEESLFTSALKVNPTKAHMNLGYVFTTQKDYEKAKFHYKEALQRQANLADAWYNLGILTTKSSPSNRNSTLEAIHYYQRALQSRSNFAAAHLNLALLLHDTHQPQKAFAHLNACLQNSGESLKSYRNHLKTQATCAYNKGRLLQKSGEYLVAIENFQLALNLGGAHFQHISSVLNSIGACYSELGDVEKAEKYFEMAISENHVNSFLTMAHLKIRQNRSYEVEGLLKKAMTLAPESVTVLQNIALAEYRMHNYNRSLLFYRRALSVDSAHLETLQGIANLLQELQNYSESEEFYRRIIEIQPNSYSSYSNYGAILHLNQKYDQALKAYDKALLLNSKDGVAKENREKVMRILRRKRNL